MFAALLGSGAVVLLPNRHLPDPAVERDDWLEFPGERLTRRGVALRAQLPDGKSESHEALIVVAVRGHRGLHGSFPASGADFETADSGGEMALLSEFLSPLLSVPASDWTFEQLVYRIVED